MKVLIVICAAVAIASAKPATVTPLVYAAYPGIVSYSAVDPIASQYHAQNILGQASYGHISGLQAHHAVQDSVGNKVGSYSHIAPDGQLISTNYVADANGYRVVTNGLPVAPQESPEVAAAREAHLAEVEAVKSRSRRATPVADTPASTSRLATPVVPAIHHPVISYAIPFYQHVVAKREAKPQTPASTSNLQVVPEVPVVASHVVTPHVVTHPVVAYSYPHIIAKREANPQTPASTSNLQVVSHVPALYAPVVASHVVSQPVVAYTYPHVIAKREANPQTPASTAKLQIVPHVPVVSAPVVTPHVVTHPVVAYSYPHVIAKRAAQDDTPAHTARLPAAPKVVSPILVPTVHGVHPVLGLYNPVVVN